MAANQIETKYVDTPEISETFTDHVENFFYDGTTLRLEFCVKRFDEMNASKVPAGRRYPVCRLVLPSEAAIDLFNKLQKLMGAMEQKGLVKRDQPPVPPKSTVTQDEGALYLGKPVDVH